MRQAERIKYKTYILALTKLSLLNYNPIFIKSLPNLLDFFSGGGKIRVNLYLFF